MRPSVPSPFSIVTKSANVRAPCPFFPATIPHKCGLSLVGKKDFRDLDGSQMPDRKQFRPAIAETGSKKNLRLCIFRGLPFVLYTTANFFRSEEHTSELQSHLNLVCRLLLEKKNNTSC